MAAAVSVVIPTFNHEAFVIKALASVFAQTFTDYEVIVVNDGSPDDTAARLRPLADAGRIHYVEQPNAGQAAARNRGLAEAGGEFVAFLDDDDLWPPDKLAWQVELLRADPGVCLVAGSARVFQGDDEEICHWNREDADLTPARLCASNPMTSPGQTLIRRSALAAVGGLREEVWGADDWDLYFRLARQGRLAIRDRTALHYRVHAGNASRQTGRMVGNALRVLRENVPAGPPGERRRLERTGTRTLFRNYAPLLVSQWKEALRRGEWRRAGESLLTLGRFWRLWVAEPRQFIGLLTLFLPVRLRAGFALTPGASA